MSRKLKQPWYKEGLQFECTQCGACCTGSSGFVQFDEMEASGMAEEMKLSRDDFLERYATPGDDEGTWEMGEVESEFGFDCVLLGRCETTGKTWCRAHRSRPMQCRTWPFWPENMRNPKSWNRAGKDCEGIGRGEFVPLRVIQREMEKTPEWGRCR